MFKFFLIFKQKEIERYFKITHFLWEEISSCIMLCILTRICPPWFCLDICWYQTQHPCPCWLLDDLATSSNTLLDPMWTKCFHPYFLFKLADITHFQQSAFLSFSPHCQCCCLDVFLAHPAWHHVELGRTWTSESHHQRTCSCAVSPWWGLLIQLNNKYMDMSEVFRQFYQTLSSFSLVLRTR